MYSIYNIKTSSKIEGVLSFLVQIFYFYLHLIRKGYFVCVDREEDVCIGDVDDYDDGNDYENK
ncbi:hypothetical protein [uncultured Polaribacter sp.]|uniref:hypothetical protein n=1 Tax=uncultured Polaribacter sp. TaxID=174711 RepID=UPI0026277027|nr:hypothetical protein [uncultured Polaribacter sp.]